MSGPKPKGRGWIRSHHAVGVPIDGSNGPQTTDLPQLIDRLLTTHLSTHSPPPLHSDDGDTAADGSSAGHAQSSSNTSSTTPTLSLSRPEIVVNADGARGTRTVVARRRPEEGAEGDEEWLVGVS